MVALRKIFIVNILILAVSAETVEQLLDNLVEDMFKQREKAIKNYDTSSVFASYWKRGQEAAYDAYNRARDSRNQPLSNLVNYLQECYLHHRQKATECRNKSYDDGAAEEIHEYSEDKFYATRTKVKKLLKAQNSLDSDFVPRFGLALILGFEGGASGSYTKVVEQGLTTSKTIDSSLNNEIAASAQAGIKNFIAEFGGSISASHATGLMNSFFSDSYSKSTTTLTIDLSEPAYIYQMTGNFKTRGNEHLTIAGGIYQTKEEIKIDEVTATQSSQRGMRGRKRILLSQSAIKTARSSLGKRFRYQKKVFKINPQARKRAIKSGKKPKNKRSKRVDPAAGKRKKVIKNRLVKSSKVSRPKRQRRN